MSFGATSLTREKKSLPYRGDVSADSFSDVVSSKRRRIERAPHSVMRSGYDVSFE